MSRPVNATMLTHIQNDTTIFPFVAVQISTASGNFYFKTNSGNVTIGGQSYLGDGSLVGVGSFTETRDTPPAGISIILSGMNSSLLTAILANNSPNYPVTIYVGLQDQNNVLIGTPIALGPYLLAEPVITVGEDTFTMSLTVEHYSSLLQRINGLLFTDTCQEQRHAGDLFFTLLATLPMTVMLWGQQTPVKLGTPGGSAPGGGGSVFRGVGGRGRIQ